MDRHVGSARRRVIENSGFLIFRDAPNVGVDHETVVLGKVLGIEFLHVLGVVEVYAAGPKGLLELGAAQGGLMVTLVAEEQEPNGTSLCFGGHGQGTSQ